MAYDPSHPERLNAPEFAAEVGISLRGLRRLIAAGKVQYRRASWRIYFLREDVVEFHERAKREATWTPPKTRQLRKVG